MLKLFFIEPKCVLHIGPNDSTRERIIPFTLETLQNCQAKQQIRASESKRKSKFDAIVLPESPDENSGYHASCYRCFTNIRSKNQSTLSQGNTVPATSESTNEPITVQPTSTSTNEQTTVQSTDDEMWIDFDEDDMKSKAGCIFCTRKIRWKNGVSQKLTNAKTDEKKARICEVLSILNQKPKVNEVQQSKCVKYHLSCLAECEHKISVANKVVKEQSNRQKIHTEAFNKVKEIVAADIINKSEVQMFGNIYQMYVAFFNDSQSSSNSFEPVFQSAYLLTKILHIFPELTKTIYRNRTYLHRSDLPVEAIYRKGFQQQEDLIARAKKVAFDIRKIVKDVSTRALPKHNITLKDIINGECDIPKELYVLIESLVKGPRSMNSTKKDKKIASLCNSIIFTMTNGSIKPSTCLTLALATKSITGSRKMINILNRMGFCVSYSLAEELETELAYGCSLQKRILPYGLLADRPNLRTHIAFDNYDKYVETSTGKDTLHDTVGIVYQNVDPESTNEEANIAPSVPIEIDHLDDNNNSTSRRRRKFYSDFNDTLETYSKPDQKPSSTLFGKEPVLPETLEKAINSNILWMLNYAFELTGTKRWFAFQSERVIDNNPIQNIGYLPNLNESPTKDDVVLKTLQMAQEIAQECNQKHIIVTYDLAIASKAFRIKDDLFPRFENVFTTLGAFHTELSYFKVYIFS